jgi:hypothetical protein
MKHRNFRALALATFLSCAFAAQAQDTRSAPAPVATPAAAAWALGTQWWQSSDSDGLSIRKPAATAYYRWESGATWHGVEAQQARYAQGGTGLEGRSLAAVGQSVDPATWLGYGYRLAWSDGPTRGTWLGEGFWSGALGSRTQWSVFGTRDRVESFSALQAGLTFDLVGASVDHQLVPGLTLVGAATSTRFSDAQDRQQLRLRAVWDALPEQGLTVQLHLKAQQGESDVPVRRYFNPDRLEEAQWVLGWRKRWEGWQLTARAGSGMQRVNNGDSTTMRTAEAQVQSPLRGKQFFKFRFGWSDTLGLGGPGYTYRSGDLSWVYPL